MNWRPKKYDPIENFFDWDRPYFGLSFFPLLDKSIAAFSSSWYPAIDVSEDDNNIVVKVDLPGLKKEKIQVLVYQDILTIEGERSAEREEKGKNYHRVERAYGGFQRSIQLGSAVDKDRIKAAYKDGELEIILPKTEESKPKQIRVDVE
jgi:HSP20 family protein